MTSNGMKKEGTPTATGRLFSSLKTTAPVSRWGDWKIWLNTVFLFVCLEVAVYSIEHARWINPQPSLTLVLFLSVIFVWLLNVARLPGWVIHIPAIIAGLLVTVWQGVHILPGTAGINQLFTVIGLWLRGGAGLQPEEDKAIFGTALVLLTWLVGYLSTWFVLHRRNAWVAVFLGMIVILVNLSNLTEKAFLFFIFYVLAGVLLIIWTRAASQPSARGRTGGYSGKSLFYLIISLFCITSLAVSLAWVTPQLRLSSLQNKIASSMPWKQNIQDSNFNILNAVPSKKWVATQAEIQTMSFGQTWHTGNDVIYTVKSARPAYWQVNIYDIYQTDSWTTSNATEEMMDTKTNWKDAPDDPGKDKLAYDVTTSIGTDVVLLTGDFASAEMPVIAHRNTDNEITSVKSVRVLSPGESYTVRTFVSDVTAGDLSGTGDNYPEDITALYLQLPANFPYTVKALSENLTRTLRTPYEKVSAIINYLAKIPYSQQVSALPAGADAVANFLFTQKKGFCLHFASAMTTMLRSIGIPARLAVGYLPGDPGKNQGEYLLRDKYYHAWTQVYFPGFGWIDFEPTPSSTESQVSLDTPLVSTPDIRQSPAWNIWYYPNYANSAAGGKTAAAPATRRTTSGKWPFSGQLEIVVIIFMGAVVAFGVVLGLVRIIRPFYTNRIWHVDRENLVCSVYGNLCRLAAMDRMVPEVQQTPREFSIQIAAIIPEKSKELEYLVQAYMENRFGPVKGKPELYREAEILKARVTVYNAILERKGKLQRYFWSR